MKKFKLLKNVIIAVTFTVLLLGNNLTFAESYKPNVNDLIFKYQTQDKTEYGKETTTDYVASLPETDSATGFIGKVAYFLLIIANILAFVSFVGSGVFMIVSMGDAEMLKKAKAIFTYTILALLICAVALALVTGITKINYFNPI